jgi:hypothetical protein
MVMCMFAFVRGTSSVCCQLITYSSVNAFARMKGHCRNLELKEDRILINYSRAISIKGILSMCLCMSSVQNY